MSLGKERWMKPITVVRDIRKANAIREFLKPHCHVADVAIMRQENKRFGVYIVPAGKGNKSKVVMDYWKGLARKLAIWESGYDAAVASIQDQSEQVGRFTRRGYARPMFRTS